MIVMMPTLRSPLLRLLLRSFRLLQIVQDKASNDHKCIHKNANI